MGIPKVNTEEYCYTCSNLNGCRNRRPQVLRMWEIEWRRFEMHSVSRLKGNLCSQHRRRKQRWEVKYSVHNVYWPPLSFNSSTDGFWLSHIMTVLEQVTILVRSKNNLIDWRWSTKTASLPLDIELKSEWWLLAHFSLSPALSFFGSVWSFDYVWKKGVCSH